MFIRTKRLFLRPAWPEDWQELHAAMSDERIVRNFTRIPWPYTPEDAQLTVSRHQDLRYPGFLVTLPSARGSRVIGGAGLHADGALTEFGFWVAPDSWGCGYATEASSAVVRLARTLGHRQLVASPFVDDRASARVLEKVGFQPTNRSKERHSRARGGAFTTREYAVTFGSASDCDDGLPVNPAEADMRAA
ncbi:GNAT family N-acetyltransferase [Novosphingobium sp. M1R2S20]|uniref:GNAT family N-acetyltransferase n=1 Tax=Novosphingobium rhizovicinum TaxID=3228928 RepID=A0ABV3RD72_9SPHN